MLRLLIYPALLTMVLGPVAGVAGPWVLPDSARKDHPGAGSAADPQTYPDKAGFEKRCGVLIPALATNDLAKWRRGYFAGGDPGKYLPGAAMARLLVDPEDAPARAFMNDARSPKEHYHFAAINWARFLPLFGAALTPETKKILASEAGKYSGYLNPVGTENHRMMNLCAAAVLPFYLEGGRLAHKDRESALREAKDKLRTYVKGLYAAGQGEWDSPTYLMFDLHGFLNIYDFSEDSEMRLIAAAALDWYTAAYALKYRDGLYGGPNQRGYYEKAVVSIADQTGWLWWGSSVEPESPSTFNYAVHAATSSWRPNAVLTHIARKEIQGLPVTMENTKPNYWFGQQLPPKAGEYPETLHIAKSFTMGSIWCGFGSQVTRFHLVANGAEGPMALTGGHPRKSDHTGKKLDEITYRDGGGRYDRSAQVGPMYVSLSRIPEDEPVKYSFVSFPAGVEPERVEGRWAARLGRAWVCVVPFGEKAEMADPEAGSKTNAATGKILKISGSPTGFAVIAAEGSDFPGVADFVRWTLQNYVFDTGEFTSQMRIGVVIAGKDRVSIRHDSAQPLAETTGVAAPSGKIFSGPYVKLEKSLLEISDGTTGYAVDFSGERPVYRK